MNFVTKCEVKVWVLKTIMYASKHCEGGMLQVMEYQLPTQGFGFLSGNHVTQKYTYYTGSWCKHDSLSYSLTTISTLYSELNHDLFAVAQCAVVTWGGEEADGGGPGRRLLVRRTLVHINYLQSCTHITVIVNMIVLWDQYICLFHKINSHFQV